MKKRAKLILNPLPWSHRAWNKLPEIVNELERAGISSEVSFTKLNEPVAGLVGEALQDGCNLVVAGGGDGTVSEVAAGLVGTGVPLGILPFGTFNNVAHSLSLSLDLEEAARTIARANTLDIDVGQANGHFFFEAAGVGLDAALFPIGEDIKEGHYEKVLQGAARFLRHRQAEFKLFFDGNAVSLRSPLIVVANGPFYGTGFNVAPNASLSDGLFDVVNFECTKVQLARHFALSAQHRYHQEVCVSTLRAREITVDSTYPLPAHADGRIIGTAPVTCRVIPRSLRVFVPEPGSP